MAKLSGVQLGIGIGKIPTVRGGGLNCGFVRDSSQSFRAYAMQHGCGYRFYLERRSTNTTDITRSFRFHIRLWAIDVPYEYTLF